jgi:hypothetical protein
MKPNWDKSSFDTPKVSFCGYILDSDGFRVSDDHLAIIKHLPRPQNMRSLRQVLGIFNFHRMFTPGLANALVPLFDILRADRFRWSASADTAFTNIKKRILAGSKLSYPDSKGTFHVYTDASDRAVGFFLTQDSDGQTKTLAYGGQVLSPTQMHYSTPKKELYAITVAIKKLKNIFQGHPVLIHSDHRAWSGLNVKSIDSTVARWLYEISLVSPKVVHIDGEDNVVADALSRLVKDTIT